MISRRDLRKRPVFVPMAPFTSSHDDEAWGLELFSSDDEIEDDKPDTEEGASASVGASAAPDLQQPLPTQNTVDSENDRPHYELAPSKSSDQRQTVVKERFILPTSPHATDHLTNLATGLDGLFRHRGDDWILEPDVDPLSSFVFPWISASFRATPNTDQVSARSKESDSSAYSGPILQTRWNTTSLLFGALPTRAPSTYLVDLNGNVYHHLQEVLDEGTKDDKEQSPILGPGFCATDDEADVAPSPTPIARLHTSINGLAPMPRSKRPAPPIVAVRSPANPVVCSLTHPASPSYILPSRSMTDTLLSSTPPLPPLLPFSHFAAHPRHPVSHNNLTTSQSSAHQDSALTQFSPTSSAQSSISPALSKPREQDDGESSGTIHGELKGAPSDSSQSDFKSSNFATLDHRVGEIQCEETQTEGILTVECKAGEEFPGGEAYPQEESCVWEKAHAVEEGVVEEADPHEGSPISNEAQPAKKANPESKPYIRKQPHLEYAIRLSKPPHRPAHLQEHHHEEPPYEEEHIAQPAVGFNMRKFASRLWVLIVLVGMMFFDWSYRRGQYPTE
ncbi:hypothetical protein P171DRAFT_444377 [Karstenula rhodostoma CBS 690.94]|uniref:Uncharacterized protein n=1 Tax=Karstenula rhodostoma CBS 690.94 TaxID=1392251 RepID=A0A9P4UCG9_9PLEO|nr:hypothetical protein P171DRAFT_444377 [Karstenula rhodostoma CBS 690.94]